MVVSDYVLCCENYFAMQLNNMNIKRLKGIIAFIMFLVPGVNFGQAPALGTASKFVLFTTNGAMTASGTMYLTHLTGNVGSNLAGSVTGFGNVDGVLHTADTATGHCTADVISLYTQLSTAISTGTIASPFGHGDTLIAGVYSSVGAATLTSNLVLNGQGNPNAVFIFQIGGLFSTDALAKVKLINGALACNVFWQIGGAVNVGTGTVIRGTIVANGQIDMASTHDTLEGRALALNAAVIVSQLVAYTPIGCGSPLLTGPAAPTLVSTAAYGVFSSMGAVSSTPVTYITGNVGANSTIPSGFDPLNVTGTIHGMDTATAAAAGDLTNVYNYLVALPADINLLDPADFGHDLVLTPHSYQITGITQLTGNFFLNAENDANAVFVIKINGAFTTSTLSRVILMNGAQAKNVYWKVDGAVDIFSNSVFNGTIVGAGAISLETGDTLNGRALTINGAVAINGSYINFATPPCIASPITGTPQVCPGFTTTLSDIDASGVWSSSNNSIATIGSSSGVLSGLAPGVDTVTYISPLACVNTVIITVNPAPAAIIGPDSVCVGSTITMNDDTSGGIWSSSNTLIGTVGSISGVVGGMSGGIDTIAYTMTTGCLVQKIITVNALPNAGAIAGMLTICPGASSTLSDTVGGGTWSSVNESTATIGSSTGIVTGVGLGTTTISYMVNSSCGTSAATTVVTVSATPDAGTITGTFIACPGTTTTLNDLAGGGVWSSVTTATATIGSLTGILTGVAPGTTTISYTVNSSCGTVAATKIVTVNPSPDAGTITGIFTVCPGATTTLSDAAGGGTWSSVTPSTATIGSSTGIVTGVAFGTTTISYTVSSSCGTAAATKIVTVNPSPNAGTIAGILNVCPGATTTLSDTAGGGVWSSVTPTTAAIGSATGVVTGVSFGTTTISYTVSNSCGIAAATSVVTVSATPNSGIITGITAICPGATTTLSDIAGGGVWSSVTAATAIVGSLTGIVTGVAPGTTTISYTVNSSCGTSAATRVVTVNSFPNAGVITGPASVCVGSIVTLTDPAIGGTWSSSNASAVVFGGVITGVTAGIDTIIYTVANLSCTSKAAKTVTVDATANAGVITGAPSVCTGSSITLTDPATGGVWSASNANVTVLAGIVTGAIAGVDTIMYVVSNACGADTATKIIVINTTPDAGVINGPSSVCLGSSITLTDAAGSGEWSASNINATVADGFVTGINAGLDTIMYTVFSAGCSATATKIVTVEALASSGVITGPSAVCTGSAITLTDLAPGGTWSASNTNATVTDGIVTGVTAGVDTIEYTVVNACSISVATKMVAINGTPDAGVINGASSVCVGTTTTLTDAAAGGEWSASNINATVVDGIVSGIIPGTDTIMYTVFNLGCSATATKAITINALPDAGAITGDSIVCVGSSITLTDTLAGGTWTASNANATVLAGIVTGATAGFDTIMYTVNNTCGVSIASKLVMVNPMPDAGIITGPSSVCAGSSVTFTDTAAGGTWSASNGTALVFGNLIIGNTAGTDTIIYAVSDLFCTASAMKTIVVDPLPDAGIISGAAVLCAGSSITLTDPATGGNWTSSNAASVADGIVTGVTAGADTIIYTVSNVCGTDTATSIVTVFLAPSAPVISTQSPPTVCSGTNYQNFGAATLPSAGTTYSWSAANAAVWAQGAAHQYALVNFDEPGTAVVTLSATIPGVSCSSQSTFTVTVGNSVSTTPEVVFFNNHFVCTPANEDSYQWGYDNIITLDSTILVGEINQDYLNESPDVAHKFYWVMTSLNGCSQKTYYITPAAITNVNNDAIDITVYPNPANNHINLEISSAVNGPVQVEVANMLGQKIAVIQTLNNKASIDVVAYPDGAYFVTCYRNGIKIGSARFIKN